MKKSFKNETIAHKTLKTLKKLKKILYFAILKETNTKIAKKYKI